MQLSDIRGNRCSRSTQGRQELEGAKAACGSRFAEGRWRTWPTRSHRNTKKQKGPLEVRSPFLYGAPERIVAARGLACCRRLGSNRLSLCQRFEPSRTLEQEQIKRAPRSEEPFLVWRAREDSVLRTGLALPRSARTGFFYCQRFEPSRADANRDK